MDGKNNNFKSRITSPEIKSPILDFDLNICFNFPTEIFLYISNYSQLKESLTLLRLALDNEKGTKVTKNELK